MTRLLVHHTHSLCRPGGIVRWVLDNPSRWEESAALDEQEAKRAVCDARVCRLTLALAPTPCETVKLHAWTVQDGS